MDMEYLKYLYKIKGIKTSDFHKIIGISPSSLYKRLRGDIEWTVGEIRKIRAVLELTDEQIKQIFDV